MSGECGGGRMMSEFANKTHCPSTQHNTTHTNWLAQVASTWGHTAPSTGQAK